MLIDLGFVPPFPLDLALLSAAAGLSFIGVIVAIVALRRMGRTAEAALQLAAAQQAAFAALDERQQRFERSVDDALARARGETAESARHLREEVANQVRGLSEGVTGQVRGLSEGVSTQVRTLAEQLGANVKTLQENTHAFTRQLADRQVTQHQSFEARLAAMHEAFGKSSEAIRTTLDQQMTVLRTENTQKLDQMRATVDEKLQTTLERRMNESFALVSERLEAVHKGLGEMQNLATGVGDLKRVLTNVKARGTWGEVQLGELLDQILTPDQYRKNTPVQPTSSERVEFAAIMPGDDEQVLLPIDSKFPIEDYERLQQAADAGDPVQVEAAARALEVALRNAARTISEKYIHPPHTTDFAFMFLPTEGLYAEALRRPGLAEELQRKYRVTIAGPTTLSAMLNGLRMGFRTLAIQKQSSEVWRVLGAVKTEFGKFGPMLVKVKKKLQEASNTIDDVERRNRVMGRALRDVETLPTGESMALIDGPATPDAADRVVEDVADIIRGTPDMFVPHETDDDPRVVRSGFFDED